jgi:hypothetical protein
MAKKKWADREFKNRNVPSDHTTDYGPIMYPYPGELFCCHQPADGDVTSAIAPTKEEAFRKWEALTLYYEGNLCS